MTKLREIAEDAFKTRDMIKGTLSGGIDPQRYILSIKEEDSSVKKKKKNPPYAGLGLTAHPYHMLDTKEHVDVFELKDKVLTLNGDARDIFHVDGEIDVFDTADSCISFYKKWRLDCPEWILSHRKETDDVTKEQFYEEWNGAGSSYVNILLIGTWPHKVIEQLNEMRKAWGFSRLDVVGGEEHEHNGIGYVSLRIFGVKPEIINRLTFRLFCKGYADIGWDETYTICAYRGQPSDDYTAEWNNHAKREEDGLYDAFVTITDPTGIKFYTGGGAVDKEVEQYYSNMVEQHRKNAV